MKNNLGAATQTQLFRRRLVVANALVLACFSLLVARLVYLQVFSHEEFAQKAESNRTSVVPIAPERGEILDRHGVVMARNNPGFSLEITPEDIELINEKEKRDDAIARLIGVLGQVVPITESDLRKFKKIKEDSQAHDSLPILTKLTEEEVFKLSAVLFRYKGVEIKKRNFRDYPNGNMGVHVMGYIGRINKKDQERLAEENLREAYHGTTHIGKVGIEQSYEDVLHGKAGYQRLQVMASGRRVDELGEEPAVNGRSLELTIDAHIQSETEKAFGNRRGALVAIEPATGEVLAFVSAPTYDPRLFMDGISTDDWALLSNHEDKPLLNRPLRENYPVGSTYKPFMAIAALHSGVRSADKVIADGGIYTFGGHRYRDSTGGRGHGMVNMFQSIAVSSDVYYYSLAHEMGVDLMHQELSRFGFGQKTGIDLIGEITGILPSKAWYKKRTGKDWSEGQTISLGIGQGENTFTILQLAYATSILANNGVGMKPHLVRSIIGPLANQREIKSPTQIADLQIPVADLDVVRRGMVQVNISGTGRGIFNGLGYAVAGKTGTAQVFSVGQNSTYSASRRNARMTDHSLYIAFAPADNPKIAIAAIVENGGFGAKAAAPIVRRTLEAFNESNAGKRYQPGPTQASAAALTNKKTTP
jgi:penicillin-binding protein 2